MAGPALPDVSTKQLRSAKLAEQQQRALNRQQRAINRRLRNQLRRLRQQIEDRLADERSKCAGKCPRKAPIYVGPKRILNTETRSVYVVGDRVRNRKKWEAVETSPTLMWHPPKLQKVVNYHKKVGKRIARHHNFIKEMSNSPLVRRHGKWILDHPKSPVPSKKKVEEDLSYPY